MSILAVNVLAVNDLAVNGAIPLDIVSKSVSDTLYSVKKCLRHYISCQKVYFTRSPCFSRSAPRTAGSTCSATTRPPQHSQPTPFVQY